MNETRDPRLQRYLDALPLQPPDPALENRIQAAHLRRLARRRRLPPLFAAAALVAALALQPALQALRSVRSGSASVDAVALAEVRALDRRMQLVYLEANRADERRALWEARAAAQARLPSVAASPRFVPL